MKKTIYTLGLCLSTLLASAQTQLDSVVVSASRFNSSLQDANRNVIVLNQEDIKNAPVNSVSELLDFATGIDARQRGTFGTQTDLSIRGGSFEQVLVLINGIRLSDPQTGHHLMNLPVQKNNIERIEILLGGGSYIFGGSAFSGAVNIITKDAKKNTTTAQAGIGSYNSYQAGITQQLAGKKHQTTFSLNRTASADGFKENTDFENTNLYAQSRIHLGESQLKLSAGYTDQGFGAQNFYSDAYPQQYEKTQTLLSNVGLNHKTNAIEWDHNLYWRRNWDEFQLYREGANFYEYQAQNGLFIKGTDTAASWYTGHNYHRSDVAGAKTNAQFESVFGRTSLGAEYRLESILSNNLGEDMSETIDIPNSRGQYTKSASRANVSISGEHQKSMGQLNVSVALLANYNSDYDWGFYPAATIGYNFNRRNKIYASYNRSFRLPSYTDLYYSLGGAVGSKDLRPENSSNYELGYKIAGSKSYFNVSVFRREGTDIIDWVQYCDTCELRATNTTQINFNGTEASYRFMQTSWMSSIGLDFIELGYSYLFTDEESFDYESLYVFDYLQHKANLRAQHTFLKNFNLNYTLSYQNRNGNYTDADTREVKAYPDVLLINARLTYTRPFGSIYVSGQNLLNKTYYDRGNVELPGLWLWSGIEILF